LNLDPHSYPVLDILTELKEKLTTSSINILQAPPGAGKSTVLPLQLMDEPWLQEKKVIMLEPRRLAARSVAARMATLLNESVGEQIGYRVRFDTKVSGKTRIEVVTEGILTRMIQSDNSLEDVGMLIFDEFHERSLHADLALALSLQMQQVLRDDLRILIMSATLDSAQLSSKLGNVPVITSLGRQHPVSLQYSTQESDQPIPPRMATAIRKAIAEEDGDVLAFLPGSGEIKRLEDLLREPSIGAVVYPLYGDLSFDKQQDAILPRKDGLRKVVLSTSIAETSLTIEGIRIVIDSGLSRVPKFDPRSGLTRLETIRVTKDAADQRAGRAGRLGPGICYRLWTQGVHQNLQPQRKPEILEADLAPLMLELAQWGIRNPDELMWITTPPPGAVSQAKELLVQLEAIDGNGITPRGRAMLKIPTHPRIAHLLLESSNFKSGLYDSVALACDIAAILEERDPLPREAGADLSLRVIHLRRWRSGEKTSGDRNSFQRIESLAANYRRIFQVKLDNAVVPDTAIGSLLMGAYPERIAQQQGKHNERYKLANGRMARLPDNDALTREPLLCVAHLDAGSGEGKIFLAAPLDQAELSRNARETEVVRWDDERGAVVAALEKRVGPLLIESKPLTTVDNEKRIGAVLHMIANKGLGVIGDVTTKEKIQARVLSLKHWRPNEAWPDVSDLNLIHTIDEWLTPFVNQISRRTELERLDWKALISSLLPWELQSRVDTLAPERIQVPSGSLISLIYSPLGLPPVMEVRLQEMFGLTETPTINEGRTRILLHLLSPGYKPVQVTQDLNSFWQTTYHEVRKELRMRYPRHHWPEDPWTAEAVRGAKRRNS
jgi:ATP-dependent helicase HrpB